ncbi:MAG: zinc ribbon domain-containing protein [Chloroflexi bacterium]|nr:zinc ribbon domain-containing protein [Chloroflexota bacterium]
MIYFLFLIMAWVALGLVAYPLWRPQRRIVAEPSLGLRDSMKSQQDATYFALTELQFDYELGNLSPQDHQELEEKYRAKAISILKELDAPNQGAALDKEVEEAIKEIRLTRGKGVAGASFCSKCGTRLQRGDRFCSNCGSPVRSGQ